VSAAPRGLVAAGLLCAAVACGGGGGEGAPCTRDAGCAAGERCASGPVREIRFEEGETGRCRDAATLIGAEPAPWPWRSGGRALGERLCTAQGISPGTSAAEAAVRARQQALLSQLGTRMVRLDLIWSRVQPAPGPFDFSAFDPMVDAAIGIGLEVILVLAYGAPWASSATQDDDRFPPDDPSDYAAFARAAAVHFAGRVTRYELWNEPNGGYRFFKPDLHGDAARYADLMVAAARAIRDACAACQVWSAGLFFHEQFINGAVEFTHDLLAARPGALRDVDAFAFHPYPQYPPRHAPEDDGDEARALGGMVADLRAVLAWHGVDPEPPLAVTELGWPSWGPVDEPLQADYVARATLLGAALGLDPLCWFNLADGPEHGTFPPEDDFGLFRFGSEDPAGEIARKPAGDAMAWLARIGVGAVPAGPHPDPTLHDPGAGAFALEFDAPRGRWTALWRTRGESGVEVALHGRAVFDARGRQVRAAAEGTAVVTAGGSPLYVVDPPR
jgi:hypothetical protein